MSKKNNLEELVFLDENLYKSLMILKYMKDDIASLDLSFSINEDVVDQET